jgi:hypothetical protein
MSANLIRNTNRGSLLAEGEVVVVDVGVPDAGRKPIARFVATLRAPGPSAVTIPADRRGR